VPCFAKQGNQQRRVMLGIPRRYSHFVFGVIQSGLTCGIASAIASVPSLATHEFLTHWLVAWVAAWLTMLPVVLLASPVIRAVSLRLTREEGTDGVRRFIRTGNR
jgi:hypothetical protein